MECYLCSRPLPATALRCPHCDWPVTEPEPAPEPTMCAGCARPLTDGAEYCEYCGWSVDVGEDPAPEPPPVVFEAPPAIEAPPTPRVKPGELYQITSVPLTGKQKRELIAKIVVPPLSLIIIIVVLTLIPALMGVLSYSEVLDRIPRFSGWLIVFLMLLGAYNWLQSVRDLGRGIAYVQLTRLTGKIVHIANKRWTYYGFFEKAGKIAISDDMYEAAIKGAIYKITYSPVRKRAWEVELIEKPQPAAEQPSPPLPR